MRHQRSWSVIVLLLPVAGCDLPGSNTACQPAPAENGLNKLRDRGRPVPGPIEPLELARGTVIAVDQTSISLRAPEGGGGFIANDKPDGTHPTGRYGRWVRRDPSKPIVLRYPGWEVDCDSFESNPAGLRVTLLTGEVITINDTDNPLRRFPAAKVLLDGGSHPRVPGRKHVHLLPDVWVGDLVTLGLDGPLGKEECVCVQIERRPGGRVPYSGLNDRLFRDLIDQRNAYQAYEEHGTPIPERFRREP